MKIKEVGLFFLIKIGKKKHMDELYEKGLIYMSNIDYFRKLEEKELRGDKNEGIIGLEQVSNVKLLHEGKEIARGDSGQLKFHAYENNGNIYSLIAITSQEDPEDFRINERNNNFGDCFVVITDVKEFIERIENELKRLKYEYEYGLVSYYDSKKHSGPLNVFSKADYFEYQKEFRFFVKRNETGPLIIKIGSIENISFIFDIEKLDKIEISFS